VIERINLWAYEFSFWGFCRLVNTKFDEVILLTPRLVLADIFLDLFLLFVVWLLKVLYPEWSEAPPEILLSVISKIWMIVLLAN
jgi:hypothetical protein